MTQVPHLTRYQEKEVPRLRRCLASSEGGAMQFQAQGVQVRAQALARVTDRAAAEFPVTVFTY